MTIPGFEGIVGLIAQVFPTGEFENWAKCELLFPHIEPLCDAEPRRTDESLKAALRSHKCCLVQERELQDSRAGRKRKCAGERTRRYTD
jgi:hypothetical protein